MRLKRYRFSQSMILFPLSVMLLLALLIGVTAYQATHQWERGASTLINRISAALIVNNIRWELREVRQIMVSDPEGAQEVWTTIQNQARMLQRSQPSSDVIIQSIVNTPAPKEELIYSLEKNLGIPPLGQMQEELNFLQRNVRLITITATVSMLALGLVLLSVTVWDLNRLFRALSRSRDLNVTIQEEERRRIAQDLHDGVVQDMIDLKRAYSPEKVERIIDNLRRVCQNLKPQMLEDLGFVDAIEFLAEDLRQAGVPVVQLNIEREGLLMLPKAYELTLFRVIQELLSNVKHHANASQVKLSLIYQPSESPWLRIHLQDNGQGFDPSVQVGKGLGLTGVEERISQLNGELNIEAAPGQGSRVQFKVPIQPARGAHESLTA